MVQIELRRYQTRSGYVPYSEWIRDLDGATAGRIQAYVDRLKTGNFGHSKSIGEGVSELKIDYGPGFRAYYLRDGKTIVVLLCGGDKKSQRSDIEQAHVYAADYWRRK